ncbi:ligase [Thermosipho melanesiensis]|uniref:Biotin/lipoate A/B protein ligase n=2 Tax=Thermosipho melanesiensis TaxID=46541 RepID=A6LJQ1_THEM4|nr:lipoate--protein ligase family protein [Thermosipho melanesiensis]ABR30152.1 biotin/lipoate A/B protein ligase [Thermosipho melanesiensis BI429]APT73351.1 ligase [Thermosipho melanesiensis]OOC38166.1 ligase [Thermosipho melanesiensis]OOC40087.1 ligase [Thermosipho melanesiensis]OOC40140.1 ligase [Thermosipho melanesiensis]
MFYIETWDLPGDLNMAIDYILGTLNVPFFRLYTWERPTLSLGKNQSLDDVNFEFLKENDIDCVRRPTGGRAVLHKDEITYSVVIPNGHSLYRLSVLKLYKFLSKLIVDALNNMGLPVKMVGRGLRGNTHICFDAPSWYEIVLNDKKVVGSAQMRTKSFVLQHGSIVLKTTYNVESCFKKLDRKITQYGLDQYKILNELKVRDALYVEFDKVFGLKKFKDLDKVLQEAQKARRRFCCT